MHVEIFYTYVRVIVYYLYPKRLVEKICYSEIVKPNILSRKFKQRKTKKEKSKGETSV